MLDFEQRVAVSGETVCKEEINCLQMNMGYVCNLSCTHCHVGAGPHRQEMMSMAVIDDCLRLVRDAGIKTVDITGGAPGNEPPPPPVDSSVTPTKIGGTGVVAQQSGDIG